MPAPFDFPGYYWDEAKGRFFKIEATGTAPEGAAWSQDQVAFQDRRQRYVDQRRRRTESSEGSFGGCRAKRRHRQDGRHPQPNQHDETTQTSSSLQLNFVLSLPAQDVSDEDDDNAAVTVKQRLFNRYPLLAHEAAVAGGLHSSATVSDGRLFGRTRATTAASTYAHDLEFKGAVPVLNENTSMMIDSRLFSSNTRANWAAFGTVPGRRMARPFRVALSQPQILSKTEIKAMYVHGEEQPPGMGIVYTNYCRGVHDTIKGQYVMVNENESVVSSWPTRPPFGRYASHERTCPEDLKATGISSICFHEASQNLIVASGRMEVNTDGEVPVLQFFKPDIGDATSSADDVTWQLGPDTLPNGTVPTRALPSGTNKPVFKIFGGRLIDAVYACAPAPRGYDALCLVGTEDGLRAIDIETVTRLTDVNVRYFQPNLLSSIALDRVDGAGNVPQVYRPINNDDIRCFPPSGLFMRRQYRFGTPPFDHWRRQASQPNLVTTVDFVNNHPQLAVAGGRNSVPWLVDLRERSWRPFGMNANAVSDSPNAVAHVRSIGEYHVVAAGLRNSMVMYDLRYLKTRRKSSAEHSSGNRKPVRTPVAEPLFRFIDYYNEDRLMGLGFDVDPTLGIVAAAESHAMSAARPIGGMGLFSLWTGERLNTPALWRIQHSAEAIARTYKPTEAMVRERLHSFGQDLMAHVEDAGLPFTIVEEGNGGDDGTGGLGRSQTWYRPQIAALSFASLPRECTSLFVGVDARIHKYSLRRGREDIFYGEDEEDERWNEKKEVEGGAD